MKKLNVRNRILIMSLLPKEGDLLTVKTLRGLKSKLEFSEEEVGEFKLQIVEGGMRWDKTTEREIEVELTLGESKLITDGINGLIGSKKLTEEHLELCEVFGIE